jgi:Ca2+-transporting ATPase
MGITGTEVAKEASAMILTDDNFATIVRAVEEGRAIYDNIKKYLLFLLSANIAEIIVLTSAFFLGLPVPLLAIQILWINLSTDGTPALALGVDPPAPDLMKRPPRPPQESVFTPRMITLIGVIALTISLIILPLFVFYLRDNPEGVAAELLIPKARTMLLVAFVMIEMVAAYCARSDHLSLFKVGPFRNKWLNLAVIWELCLLILMIEVGKFRPILKAVPLTLNEWLALAGIALLLLPITEMAKLVLRRLNMR